MNLAGLAFAYLRRRWGQAVLSIIVGALGIAAVATTTLGFAALPEAAERAWGGAELVVGPKGSALDLVLCCVLHLANSQGLVSQKAALAALENPMIRAAAPIALGDNINGLRIMGTTPAILDVYRARIAQGGMWTDKLQAVLGAGAAQTLHMKVGDTFVGAHGLAAGGELHEKFPYKVVGILQPTGSALDRLVLTDIETVRYIHVAQAQAEIAEHGTTDEPTVANLPDAATAVVASFRTPVAAAIMPRLINATDTLTAASPSFEIARLAGYARPLTQAIAGLGALLIAIAATGAAVGLMAIMSARTRDFALLRVLGAGSPEIAAVAFAEALMIGTAALALGGALTAALLMVAARLLAAQTGLLLAPQIDASQAGLIAIGTLVAVVISALFPAARAARSPIEEILQP